ncbi:putative AbiEi antitoxin of type IV toxin-antitoxin system [Pseudonocardia sediminis]|uniref:Putative AbiEi antitoxin of type IV toxin-antitoxin system n=1 Tax=Pseudonocardia sediminis TaxID=1397368 RepID=A0A4Q7UVF7_PSEST|nr:type IV toxin-antitoxin system AbiEi family antitoxin domain-containing protein [Pseudonocardia sediminis]RZT85967.1 putative AbiEi antitoxin of type IV toxin-antitoxin system [Pseudonocardia sediminis]
MRDGMRWRGVATRAELLAAGWTEDELRRMCRRGEIRRIGHGAYLAVDDAAPDGSDAGDHWARLETEHRLRAAAAVRRADPGVVVSHVSAALVHGLPCWGLPLDRAHLTRDRRSGARRTGTVHLHVAPLPAQDVEDVSADRDTGARRAGEDSARGEQDTVAVTTPARTVVDIARSAGFVQAVVVADAALRRPDRDRPPLVTRAELSAALDAAAGRPGTAAARRVMAFADGRSGSVGESRSRVALAAAGLPAPELQWEVAGPSGLVLATVDFAWPEHRVVAEFDGRIKYGRLVRRGERSGDAVFREKQREDTIRTEHYTVVRWTWQDLPDLTWPANRIAHLLGL